MSSSATLPLALPDRSSPAAHTTWRPAEPLRAIVLLIAGLLFFSISDVTAKYLNRSLPSIEICWLRYAGFCVVLLPSLLSAGPAVFRAAAPAWQLGRGIAMLGSALLFIFATRYLPIADATATGFVSPAFITALAIPMLGERVGRQRWAAIAVGLAGVLVITRPGGSGFHWASLLPVASASSWALAVVVTRRMGGRDGMLTTLGYTALIGFAGISCLMPLVAVWPSPQQAALGLLIGASTAAGQYLILIAYRSTDASLLAPFSYSQLIWSIGLGILVFGALPDRWTLAGGALIVGSGLSIALGERRRPFYPKTAAA